MIPIVLGTRGSALALAQTRQVMAALKRAWPRRNFEIRTVKTEGDRISESPAAALATVKNSLDKGLFTAELENALRAGQIHIAVHSLKDLPTEDAEGLAVVSVPVRADARDVLVTRGEKTLQELPSEGRIATGSPRRGAQLKLARPDLEIVEIRGNIDTRLRKFRENHAWAGIVLAAAGLERLKPRVDGLVVTPLPFEVMLPAPGQGALALQTQADAADILELVTAVHDPATAAAVKAERIMLHALGGGCREPIAAYAQVQPDGMLRLDGLAWLFGETEPRRGHLIRKIEHAERLGIELAVELAR
jgi:hydroxymethylbilane synthase